MHAVLTITLILITYRIEQHSAASTIFADTSVLGFRNSFHTYAVFNPPTKQDRIYCGLY